MIEFILLSIEVLVLSFVVFKYSSFRYGFVTANDLLNMKDFKYVVDFLGTADDYHWCKIFPIFYKDYHFDGKPYVWAYHDPLINNKPGTILTYCLNDRNMFFPYDNGYNMNFFLWSEDWVEEFRNNGNIGKKLMFTLTPPFLRWEMIHISELKDVKKMVSTMRSKPHKNNCIIDHLRNDGYITDEDIEKANSPDPDKYYIISDFKMANIKPFYN